MIRINFLPEQKVAARRSRWSPMAAGVSAAVLLAVGGGVFYAVELATLHALQIELGQTRGQAAQVQGLLKQAQALHKQEDQLLSRLASYEALRGRNWSQVLLGLADRTPSGLSWNQVVADDTQIDIKGHTRSLTDVAQFMSGIAGDTHMAGSMVHTVTEDLYRYGYDMSIQLAPRITPEGGKADGPK